ncbi:MAG: hypothetical protein WCQ16_04350 [Verrucomicrobiae bacterium]
MARTAMTMSSGGRIAEHLSVGLLARSYPKRGTGWGLIPEKHRRKNWPPFIRSAGKSKACRLLLHMPMIS